MNNSDTEQADRLTAGCEQAGDVLVNSERRIAAKIRGREIALELLSLAMDEPPEVRESIAEGLCKALSTTDAEKKPDAAEPPQEPIARLAAVRLDFGLHKGKFIDDVPLDYLDWLCGETEETARKLRAYLKHPELEGRRQGESE